MDEYLHKRMVAVGGLVLGLPALAAGGTVAVLGLMVVIEGKGSDHTSRPNGRTPFQRKGL